LTLDDVLHGNTVAVYYNENDVLSFYLTKHEVGGVFWFYWEDDVSDNVIFLSFAEGSKR